MLNQDQPLAKQKCQACQGQDSLLTEAAIAEYLNQLPNWNYDASDQCIKRTVKFKGFYKTMAFVNAVAWIAHDQQHHPDLSVHYNACVVYFKTHALGGVTINDLICAHKVEELLADN